MRIRLLPLILRIGLLFIVVQFLILDTPVTAFAADPASRHRQLAEAISTKLQLHQESDTGGKTYVHWVHLDQDAWVDAIVIFKRHEGSCAFATAKCSGYLMHGSREGYTIIASFLPNHHPFYLGPRSSIQPFRNLYQTRNGEQFDEIIFRDGQYQINRRKLSLGQVKDLSRWSITEAQFDDLAEQTVLVSSLGAQVLGAPIHVDIPEPPLVLKKEEESVPPGHKVAKRLEGRLQEVFNRVAARHFLSHTVQVQLVACGDWITRIPLANQQDRSSRQVVGCLEPMGIAEILKSKWDVDDEVQFQMLLHLLTGSLGQALALQDHLTERLAHYLESDPRLASDFRQLLSTSIHLSPHSWFYLYGHRVMEPINSANTLAGSIAFWKAVNVGISMDRMRKEHNVLREDVGHRFQSALCAQNQVHNFSPANVYETLKRQFKLPDSALTTFNGGRIESIRGVDEEGKVLNYSNCQEYGWKALTNLSE